MPQNNIFGGQSNEEGVPFIMFQIFLQQLIKCLLFPYIFWVDLKDLNHPLLLRKGNYFSQLVNGHA